MSNRVTEGLLPWTRYVRRERFVDDDCEWRPVAIGVVEHATREPPEAPPRGSTTS